MCGRFTLRLPPQVLQSFFDLIRPIEYVPNDNVCPTQYIVAIRRDKEGRYAEKLFWGLIPSWSKDRSFAAKLINARSETLAEKNSFKNAFRKRRCLIPASGFYEWQKIDKSTKQPCEIGMKDNQPFAMAGLWENWTDPETKEKVPSATIITTQANELLEPIHERMPVILPQTLWDVWLDTEVTEVESLQPLLRPYPAEQMKLEPLTEPPGKARSRPPGLFPEYP
ncbi:MAG TPA: SOS response-associated peptidase [Planctomycetaceae bacterium]|nr:SOS response-associated peptidase [Planctomycetaceae bacterium]